jgi:hypothetical protein
MHVATILVIKTLFVPIAELKLLTDFFSVNGLLELITKKSEYEQGKRISTR